MIKDFLNHPETERIIREGLHEDIREGDHTSLATIPEDKVATGTCYVKDNGIIAGMAVAERIFHTLDPELNFNPEVEDGHRVSRGEIAFIVIGKARPILMGERLVLNIMQRMSGIATQTFKVADEIAHTGCRLLDTRKTTPLMRHFEKWAVRIGGGVNHRFGLYDMILIKDNHIDVAGGIGPALHAARQYLAERKLDLKIEIETRSLDEVREVLDAGGADRILLDNMPPEALRQAVKLIAGRYATEASGGIYPENALHYAETGVDFLSMGALTHSFKSLDISLKLRL